MERLTAAIAAAGGRGEDPALVAAAAALMAAETRTAVLDKLLWLMITASPPVGDECILVDGDAFAGEFLALFLRTQNAAARRGLVEAATYVTGDKFNAQLGSLGLAGLARHRSRDPETYFAWTEEVASAPSKADLPAGYEGAGRARQLQSVLRGKTRYWANGLWGEEVRHREWEAGKPPKERVKRLGADGAEKAYYRATRDKMKAGFVFFRRDEDAAAGEIVFETVTNSRCCDFHPSAPEVAFVEHTKKDTARIVAYDHRKPERRVVYECPLTGDKRVTELRYLDGRRILIELGGDCLIVDTATGAATPLGTAFASVAMGRGFVALTENKRTRVLRSVDLAEVGAFAGEASGDRYDRIALSAKGTYAAYGVGYDVVLRSVADGAERMRLPLQSRVDRVAFSADEAWLCVVRDYCKGPFFYEVATGKCFGPFTKGAQIPVTGTCYGWDLARDGSVLAVGTTREELFFPDGRRTLLQLTEFVQRVHRVVLADDGKYLLSCGDGLRLLIRRL